MFQERIQKHKPFLKRMKIISRKPVNQFTYYVPKNQLWCLEEIARCQIIGILLLHTITKFALTFWDDWEGITPMKTLKKIESSTRMRKFIYAVMKRQGKKWICNLVCSISLGLNKPVSWNGMLVWMIGPIQIMDSPLFG